MPKLSELTKVERAEVCRSIARAAHECLSKKTDENGCVQGGTFDARMFKKCSELGIIEDDEFYGNAFSAERIEVLKGFVETYDQALELAKVYDEAIADMACLVGDFAMPSHMLVRMYCVSRFSAKLHEEDSPFADLRVTVCVGDDGADDEEKAESDDDGDDDYDDEDNDSIVVTTSDEEEEAEEDDNDDDDDDDDDDNNNSSGPGSDDDAEEVQPGDAEEPEGPRRAKKPRVEEMLPQSDASGSASDDD